MSSFLDPKLSGLVAYTPGEQPRDMGKLIKLNTNESPFPPGPKVLEALNAKTIENLRLYPDLHLSGLRGAVADFYGIAPEQVFAANGSDDVLAFCFHGLCPRGAVFADLTYGFYPVFAAMFGVAYESIPLREDFSLEVADYAEREETVFIANPNAPTGICLPLTKIRELLSQNPERLVVVDEAYIDFGGESAVSLLKDFSNLLVVQTFSKSRQLAGVRLGIALASPELIADLNTLKYSFNPYGVNTVALLAGEAAMRDEEYYEYCRGEIIRAREYTAAELRQRGFSLTDSKTNFLFAKPRGMSGEAYYQKLRAQGILVRHFPGERTGDYVRITVGTMSQMETLVAATDRILNEVEV